MYTVIESLRRDARRQCRTATSAWAPMVTSYDTSIPAEDRRLSIGLFAALTGLTRKALKTYERQGLLRPAYVDPETRYRFYSLRQLRAAETIRLLRGVGVPLSEIAAALRDDRATPLSTLLERRRERVEAQLAAIDRLRDHLENTTAGPCGGLAIDVTVRTMPEHFAIVCGAQCSHPTHTETVDRLLDRLDRLSREHGLTTIGRETATYHANLDITHDYLVEASVPIDFAGDRRTALPPSCHRVSPVTVASAVHMGPYSEMSTTFACLASWVADRGLPLGGRFSETYVLDERDTDDPGAYRTEVCLSIASARVDVPVTGRCD